MENVFKTKQMNNSASVNLDIPISQIGTNPKPSPQTGYQNNQLPDHLQRFKTKDSIPGFFRDEYSLPGKLSISDDKTMAGKEVNQSYER